MLSISDNDSEIIEFLLKNYSKRYTIREIALKLNISPAGAHKSLKKLEEGKIVKSEKLGTGLFYEIDFDNRAARHLTAFILAQDKSVYDIESIKENVKALIVNKKVLLVSDVHDIETLRNTAAKIFTGKNIVIMSEEEFMENIRKTEKELVEILKGIIVYGEELIVEAVSEY